MAFHGARLWVGLILLAAGAGTASGQMQPVAPQGQAPARGAQQLGRAFPRQMAPPPVRKAPQVHVSIVSPQQSSTVFQHIGRQGTQSNGGRGMGGMGAGGPGAQ